MMIRFAALAGLILWAAPGYTQPAFPEAEGFAADATGGRGGTLYVVDSLADSGTGTLREAIDASGCRMVVFRTGGTIVLESSLIIGENNGCITIAGQSAPGDGIQIRNESDSDYGWPWDSFPSLVIDGDNVVIRYLRVRPGTIEEQAGCTERHALGQGSCAAANDIQSILISETASDVMLDHVSLSFASARMLTTNSHDISVQWSIISEGLNYVVYGDIPGNPTETFAGKGLTAGNKAVARAGAQIGRQSVHHNLFAHISARMPQLGLRCEDPAEPEECHSDIVNNVIYNWEEFGLNVANNLGHTYVNVVNNWFREGGDSEFDWQGFKISDWIYRSVQQSPAPDLEVHFTGNERYVSSTETEDMPIDCKAELAGGGWEACDENDYQVSAHPTASITTTSAVDAFSDVLADSGASRRLDEYGAWVDMRDSADDRAVDDTEEGTGEIIHDDSEFPGWPTLDESPTPPTDADLDGMPEAWEEAHCMDDSTDNDTADMDGDGYRDLEEYLNGTLPNDNDGDDVENHEDNCRDLANAAQEENDATPDGYGDMCDCDFDGDDDCDTDDDWSFWACKTYWVGNEAACAAHDMDSDYDIDQDDQDLYDAASADGQPGPGADSCS